MTAGKEEQEGPWVMMVLAYLETRDSAERKP